MKESETYRFLINHLNELSSVYSLEKMCLLGKDLSYDERIKFEYKTKCHYNNSKYQESLVYELYEREFINNLIKNNELDYIINNIENIIKKESSLTDELLAYLKDNSNLIDITKIEKLIIKYISYNSLYDDSLYNFIKEVVKKEDSTILDIRKINTGAYSKVYRVSNKVIKIGNKRICPDTINNSRILLPDFKGYINENYIEVTDYLEPTKDIYESDLYDIYSELRDQGIIWIDIKKNNLARLDKKTIEKQNIKRNDKLNGIINNPNYIERDLKEDDLVIIDLDHIIFDYEKEKLDYILNNLDEELVVINKIFSERYESKIYQKKK